MTEHDWRQIATEESETVRAIVSASGNANGRLLVDDLDGALVRNEAAWILDIKVPSANVARAVLPDGPFPVRAFVTENGNYQGEIIVWVTDGRVSGLEYAWVSDEPPTRWPRREEMELVPQDGL
ncbi:Uncharacterised protein [Mycolicibacterium vanbaalenii]|uniref:Uncharacterized protein n=1 Tax=Mycolicibacterium vanbaalenii TaxID=110539 RepID=A0A5S9RBI3_MYCVN|nr:Uncharacterised protein [Mycolicibacterium vanbaalenii]